MGLPSFATKQDIKLLETDLKKDIKALEVELRTEMKMLETRLEASTDIKLAALKADLLKWFVSISMAQTGLVASLFIAAVKFIK